MSRISTFLQMGPRSLSIFETAVHRRGLRTAFALILLLGPVPRLTEAAPTCARALMTQAEYEARLNADWRVLLPEISLHTQKFKTESDRAGFLASLERLPPDKRGELLELIRSHYPDAQYYKQGQEQKDMVFRTAKKSFDHALSALRPPTELLTVERSEIRAALASYLNRQSQDSAARDPQVAEKVFASLAWLQSNLRQLAHNPALRGAQLTALGSFVNGRGHRGVSDLDVNVDSKAMFKALRARVERAPVESWGIDHISVAQGGKFDFFVTTAQSPLAFRITADEIVLEIYEPKRRTPVRVVPLDLR